MKVITKSGTVLEGRPAEIYADCCPPERPCTPEQVAHYRKLYDAPPRPRPSPAFARFMQAIARELVHRAKGGKGPTAEEKAARRALCDACERRDPAKDLCQVCGCYLEAGALPPRPLGKLDCACESCPLGLWLALGACAAQAGCSGCQDKGTAKT